MRKIIILGFICVFPLLAMAEIPGFEDSGIKTLRVETRIHFNSTKTGSKDSWEIKVIDFAGNRLYRAEYEGAEKPHPDEQPVELAVSHPDLATLVSHPNKKVIYSKGRELDSSDFITPNGLKLLRDTFAADIVKHAQSANILEASGETYIFEIREPFWKPPFFSNPVQFTLDKNHRVVEVVNRQEKSFTRSYYQWERLEEANVDYLKRSGGSAKDVYAEIQNERVIEKIEVNPEFSPDLFELNIPSDYKVIDNRKLLQPLNIPGLGGGAGRAGSSQKP